MDGMRTMTLGMIVGLIAAGHDNQEFSRPSIS
jgi:hypothetical protein